MRSTRWMALAALLAAGVLAFAACGSDSDDNGDGGDGDTTPVAQKTTADGGSETAESEPTEDDGDDNGDGAGGSAELQALAEKFAEATFKVTYEISGDAAGLGNGEITIAKDGTDKIRFDIKSEQDGEPFEGSFIQTATDSYLCFSGEAAAGLGAIVGEDTSAGVCVKSSTDDPTNPVGSLVDSFGEIGTGNVEVQSKEDTEIAGHDATCYTVLDKDTNETSVACLTDDGVLLSVDSSAGGSFTAKSVEEDVSDSDFEPPYPITEIPGLGQ